MKSLLLGCIADDSTGATDLANNLVRAGMRAVQTIGVPTGPLAEDVDAVVVALKSRTVHSADAVAQSLRALKWLQEQGAAQIYFKYCSTFDSTPKGNIGPVIDALMDALATDFTIACPAFPENKRTIFKGYLFAGDVPLNESGMQNHPLTPMTDANLVRVLQAQTRRKVGLIDYTVVGRGPEAIHARIAQLRHEGIGIAIVDALSDDDLRRIGPAVKNFALVTAGSGVAIALPANWGIQPSAAASTLPLVDGPAAIVSGSCSVATQRQVREFGAGGGASFFLDPVALAQGTDVVDRTLALASKQLGRSTVLVYSTAEPAAVQEVQRDIGAERAGRMVEDALAQVAKGLVERGVRRLVVAGGETSGAVLQALEIEQLRIGPQIDPGVPWCAAYSPVARDTMHLSLKSGNFGAHDFFTRAFLHG